MLLNRTLTVLFRRHGCLCNGRLALSDAALLALVLDLTGTSSSGAKAFGAFRSFVLAVAKQLMPGRVQQSGNPARAEPVRHCCCCCCASSG
jgi:hypothetical protein